MQYEQLHLMMTAQSIGERNMSSSVVNVYVPGIASFQNQSALMAVLTQDAAGQYACYIATVPGKYRTASQTERQDIAEWVAHNGTKQSYKDAQNYFRGFDENKYRH
jgi:hypothetical protein